MTRIDHLTRNGIRRRGSKRSGFRYEHAGGRRVSAAERARIEALKIPPAWQDVAIHPSPRALLQAVGRDAAGRWQYRYHPAQAARREREKYPRLLAFAESLSPLRRRLRGDLSRPGLTREKVLACALRLLSCCFMRPGSARYAEQNGSFGVATLRRRHVSVQGDWVHLDFAGKSGKRQRRELKDRRIAAVVRQLLRYPGEVFKYRGEDGGWVDIRRRDLNEYIKEAMGDRFSAKDFRTWAGTFICACALARFGVDPHETRADRRRKVRAAIRETAQRLGNTPAVCRASYILPRVLTGFERGRVLDDTVESFEELVKLRSRALHPAERALLKLLRAEAA